MQCSMLDDFHQPSVVDGIEESTDVRVEYPVPSIYSSASSWVSEVSPAARNTLDFARIPRASKLLICGLFQKGRVLAQDGHHACLISSFVRAPGE